MSTARVDVLLATYNGEKYLTEQIESLLSQTYTDFKVVARDDGSKDGTLAILAYYEQSYPEKFVVVRDGEVSGAAQANFARLTAYSDAEYLMYCDQDDYWYPEKIEQSMAVMQQLENDFPGAPLLVHSDLRVVDAQRNVISSSLWRYQGLNPERTDLNHLVVQNNITGCTVLINKKLKEMALPFPKQTIMHDWWLALVAAATGRISAIDRPLIDYRQHGANDTGAKRYDLKYVMRRIVEQFSTERLKTSRKTIARTTAQASALLKQLGSSMEEGQRSLLGQFVRIGERNFISRRYFIIRHGFMKQGLARRLAYLLAM